MFGLKKLRFFKFLEKTEVFFGKMVICSNIPGGPKDSLRHLLDQISEIILGIEIIGLEKLKRSVVSFS